MTAIERPAPFKGERFREAAEAVRAASPDRLAATALLDAACFAGVESSYEGLRQLAELAGQDVALTRAGRQLLRLLGLALDGPQRRARTAARTVDRDALDSALLLAMRLALSEADADRARYLARLLADRHAKGVKAHPDLPAVLALDGNRVFGGPRPPGVAICSSLKNESEYLEEWVRFHAGIGVEHFYLYDNASTDDTGAIIARLATEFAITAHLIIEQPGQKLAINHFLAHHAANCGWVAFIDGDEFINLDRTDRLPEALAGFGEAAAVACHWRNFGSSGHERTPPGPCLDAFTYRAREPSPYVKTIARGDRIVRMVNPHQFLMLGETVDGANRPIMLFQGKAAPAESAAIRINHYIVKSREQWEAKKRRGRPLPEEHAAKHRDDNYFRQYDRNETEDRSILRLRRGER